MKQSVAILEIAGLGPALVTLNAIEKAAAVEVLQYELNDFYGVCARIAGAGGAGSRDRRRSAAP